MITNEPKKYSSARWPNQNVFVGILLAASAILVFWQLRTHQFINFDDDLYVTRNPVVAAGLTGKGFVWAMSDHTTGTWHPLTWLSLMLDGQIYGMNPAGFLTTNLIFHIGNILLLFFLLLRMTGERFKSALVAALFAIHPLHVESVAWVSERKDVLSTFFGFSTIWAYVRYVENRAYKWYGFALLFFVMSLLSKPMLVTLPFVLVLLDHWPLRRIQSIPRIFIEKTPFFFLAGVSSALAFLTQWNVGAFDSLKAVSFSDKLANAVMSYSTYIGKMFWPFHLSILYPYSTDFDFWKISGAALLLVSVSFFVIRKARKKPWLAVGWFWYLGTLVPVIGLVQIGPQALADRYTYVPLVGLFILMVWSIPKSWSERWIRIAAGVSVSILMVISWQQTRCWLNSVTLYEHALAVTTGNVIAQNNLGLALVSQGNLPEGIEHYNLALKSNPAFADARINLGSALFAQGKDQDAIHQYSEVLRTDPMNVEAHYNAGVVLARNGKLPEARTQYEEVLKLKPEDVRTRSNLGVLLASEGKTNEAIAQYTEALRIDPTSSQVHNNLGFILSHEGKTAEAIEHFTQALRVQPDYADAHYNLGIAYTINGNQDAAQKEFLVLEKMNPELAHALYAKIHK